MYLDLKSKLQMYKSNPLPKHTGFSDSDRDIHRLLEGTVLENEDGRCFVLEKRYPLTYLYGGYPLGRVLETEVRTLRLLSGEDCGEADVSKLLFLDTETTGLSGGTGTIAFLIGTGYFTDECFVLRQYFIRDYDEEAAALRDLNRLLSGFRGLVTFNGKAFDWNLLKTRFTFNRIRLTCGDLLHIDLLFPSRKLWKLKLESCRLSSIEENILREYRTDDVPGALIPQLYFHYLESRNAVEMVKVMKHNELDILSMVSLLARIHEMLEDPVEKSDGGAELLGVGSILGAGGETDAMTECLERCMQSQAEPVRSIASRRLTKVYKSNGRYDKAVEHWESVMDDSRLGGLFPLIELAKYYEHREKNIPKALEMVEKAIKVTSCVGTINNIYYAKLKKRMDRLKRKAGRMQHG